MIKDHCLVGRSERSEVRHGKPDEILCVELRLRSLRRTIYYDNLSIRNGIS